MRPRNIMVVFGTRPEAIKLSPLIIRMREKGGPFKPYVLATGQHDRLMNQVLEAFEIKPDDNLEIMSEGQTLTQITTRALAGIHQAMSRVSPDLILVQGDTTTAFAAALAAFYGKVRVGHVEAGLRTHDKFNPYPEEMNRRLVSNLADFHFAPTPQSARELSGEGIPEEGIFVTGNTVIDALLHAVEKGASREFSFLTRGERGPRRLIVLTLHRRESFGAPMRGILSAVLKIAMELPNVEVVFPVHPNPAVLSAVSEIIGHQPLGNLHRIDPLGYLEFVQLMNRSTLILTDSGGIQEEAPSLGKPVLVLREVTERPEGIEAGCARLVGTRPEAIFHEVQELLQNPSRYEAMAQKANPYGDGHASQKILAILRKKLVGP